MTKITVIPKQSLTKEFEPRNFTQVGGIYGSEIKPEEFLTTADVSQFVCESEVEEAKNGERESHFFRVE